LSLFSDATWQLIRHGAYSNGSEYDQFIKGGEIIKLKHTELGEQLTADFPYSRSLISINWALLDKTPEIFTRLYTGIEIEEKDCLSSLW
jgi:hypothetical protein